MGNDPQEFLDGVHKVLSAMRVTPTRQGRVGFISIEGSFSNMVQSIEG